MNAFPATKIARATPPATPSEYTCSVFDATTRPPLAELVNLMNRAFGNDYSEKCIVLFDEHYLNWLLSGDGWFGIGVRDASGRLVGCELAIPRDAFWNGHKLRAYYATLLSVDPQHRGRGLAQRIVNRLADEVFNRRGADVIVSTLDQGAAGQPTVAKSVQESGDLRLQLSAPLNLWACSSNLREVDRYEPLRGVARLALCPGIRQLVECSPSSRDRQLSPRAISLADGLATAPPTPGFGFAAAGSPARMYRTNACQGSGTLAYDDHGRGLVTVAWHMETVVKPGLPQTRVATIQFVSAGGAGERRVARVLRDVNRRLLDAGCISTAIFDTGMVSRRVLWSAGFRPTPRQFCIGVRGPKSRLERFGPLAGPYFVDML